MRNIALSNITDIYGGRWADESSLRSVLSTTFWKSISLIGIIAIIGIFTYSSFSIRYSALQYNKLGPWPDSFDYTYGAVGLLFNHSYQITWDRCPLVWKQDKPDELFCAVTTTDRKSYYTPGTSILMVPYVAIGGDNSATLLDFTSALLIGSSIIFLSWRYFTPPISFVASIIYFFSPSQVISSSTAMSDLPTSLLLLAVSILISRSSNKLLFVAGILSAYLVWMRPQMIIISALSVAFVILLHNNKYKLLVHIAPMLVMLGLLGVWQYVYYGSPITTGYQYNAELRRQSGITSASSTEGVNNDTGDTTIGKFTDFNAPNPIDPTKPVTIFDFFSSYYLAHPAWHSDQMDVGGGNIDLQSTADNIPVIPNPLYYILVVVGGLDGYLFPIGIGLFGILGLIWMGYSSSNLLFQSFSFIGVNSIVLTYFTYIFYYYRSDRFFIPTISFIIFGFTFVLYKACVQIYHAAIMLVLSQEQ